MIQRRKTVLEKKRSRFEKGRFNFSRIIFQLLLLIFLVTVVYAIFFSDFLVVSAVTVSGGRELSAEEIRKKVEDDISSKYFGIIRKDNLIFVRESNLEKNILESFKKIEKIDIKKKFPNGLEVDIFERETKLVLSSGDKNFLIDENGKAYDEICRECEADFPILQDLSGSGFNFDEDALEKNYLEYLEKIEKGTGERLEVREVRHFETPSLVSGDVRAITPEGWKIFFNMEISAAKELEMLKVFLDEKVEKGRRGELEYVDLRADNKIFYKFKGENEDNSEDVKDEMENQGEVKGEQDARKDEKKDKKKKK